MNQNRCAMAYQSCSTAVFLTVKNSKKTEPAGKGKRSLSK
jgi:hypothetical protein